MTPVVDTKMVETIQSRLAEIEEKLKDFSSLLNEKKALQKMLSIATVTSGARSNGSGDPSSLDETLVAVLAEVGHPIQTPALAQRMGVKSQSIARKLLKLRDEGRIKGNKESGYFI